MQGVRADPNMGAPLAHAQQNLGSAIQAIGQPLEEYGTRVQNAINFGKMADADTKMKTAYADFQTWTETNPDQTKWADEWKARADEAQSDILAQSDLAPVVKDHLSVSLRNWQADKTSEVGRKAVLQQIDFAKADTLDAYNAAIAENDAGQATAVIHEGVVHGLFHPHEEPKLAKAAVQKVATNLVSSAIEANPIQALDMIDEKNDDGSYKHWPELNASTRLFKKVQAQKQSFALQRDTMKEADTDKFQGNPWSEEQVSAAVEAKTVSPAWAKKYLRPGADFDPEAVADVKMKIMGFNPGTDHDSVLAGTKLEKEVYDLHLPPTSQAELLSDLKKKSDPKSELSTPAAKLGQKSITEAYQTGLYGSWKKDEFGAPVDPADPAAQQTRQKAAMTMADNLTALNTYLGKTPNATPADVQKFVNGLHTHTAVQAARAEVAAPYLAPQVSADDRLKRMEELLKKHK